MSTHLFGGPDFAPAPSHPSAVVRGARYRFTVLSSRLIRLEWSPTGEFVDHQTQIVVNRDFGSPAFEVMESDTGLEIRTEHLTLSYDKEPFSPVGLSIALRHNTQGTLRTRWRFGDDLSSIADGNLGGTARTLDGVDGACPIEPGILSRYGFAVVEDSSVQVGVDDWIAPRADGGHDLYFFGHGLDFRGALADYFRLTGPVPLVPRAALGNWWSRFWRYSERDYLELMDRFAQDGIPFSVAVVDMDWHLVDIDPDLGSGWTGYTWNRELFPDPPRFLDALHERGKLVSLNLHPADGVRAHEDAYRAMASELGIDPSSRLQIPFDITDPAFVSAYLRLLHHPLEGDGVDFWWLDWQSGAATRIPGLDPLWMLNHIHYRDSGRNGARPMTFSRYAGLGSHRYPIGFSGDTVTTWDSLAFQPYFTATAANVGYTWWSHDIGGHYGGRRDDELSTRWLQFGVFSPIMRLHSSADAFSSKDPAGYARDERHIMTRFLRLRHQLVPYLYTAAWRAHDEGVAVVRPMYHDYPESGDAFEVPNQYLFGNDMIVAPLTTPVDAASGLAGVSVWLPEGTWFDLFTGQRYEGGRHLMRYRPLAQIPVLVRAGTVVPLLDDPLGNIAADPEQLVLRVVPGAGTSEIHEDDGSASPRPEDRVTTRIGLEQDAGTLTLRVEANSAARELTLDLVGCTSIGAVFVDGTRLPVDVEFVRDEPLAAALRVQLGRHELMSGIEVQLKDVVFEPADAELRAFELLDRAPIDYASKNTAMAAMRRLRGIELAQTLHAIDLPSALRGALLEVGTDSAP